MDGLANVVPQDKEVSVENEDPLDQLDQKAILEDPALQVHVDREENLGKMVLLVRVDHQEIEGHGDLLDRLVLVDLLVLLERLDREDVPALEVINVLLKSTLF